jgi:hypothetical protein
MSWTYADATGLGASVHGKDQGIARGATPDHMAQCDPAKGARA